jgi:hypothetical protein
MPHHLEETRAYLEALIRTARVGGNRRPASRSQDAGGDNASQVGQPLTRCA